MASLILKNICKSFGKTEVLRSIDLEIKDGEFLVLVGPSGCGKSTLLRIIAGLDHQTEGELMLDSTEVTNIGAAARGLAMVFQSYALYPHMTVYQNMAFGLENTRMPIPEIKKRVVEVSSMLQLSDLLGRKPNQLSGGQQQRVAIGRAMVREPKAFLFDEPLSNLDAKLRVAMRKELAGLHMKIETTMIYVTHDQVEAMTLADRIVVMHDGVIEQTGTPLEVYNNPNNLFVAGFIGSPRMNFIDVVSIGNRGLQLANGQDLAVKAPFDIPASSKFTVGIRPEHLQMVEAGQAVDLECSVEISEQLGGESYLYCHGPAGSQITLHTPGQNDLRHGDRIKLAIPVDLMKLFGEDGNVITS